MSGSGVWRLPLNENVADATTEIGPPVLTGINFYRLNAVYVWIPRPEAYEEHALAASPNSQLYDGPKLTVPLGFQLLKGHKLHLKIEVIHRQLP